jgi:histone-lysine N-methyltransferase SUV39H
MWGLNCSKAIPANSFIIEYCGEVLTKTEADRRGEEYDSENINYLFDLNKYVEICNPKSKNKLLKKDEKEICVDDIECIEEITKVREFLDTFPLCLDAYYYGNLSRFINHSCDPNLHAF